MITIDPKTGTPIISDAPVVVSVSSTPINVVPVDVRGESALKKKQIKELLAVSGGDSQQNIRCYSGLMAIIGWSE